VADADPDRAVFVMNAHCDDRPLKAGVGHSRHGEEQLAGQEGRLLNHGSTMVRGARSSKP